MKNMKICPQCIAKSKVTSLNKVEISLEVTNCSVCGKYGFMRELDAGRQMFYQAGIRKELERKAEYQMAFKRAKAEKLAETEKAKVVRKPMKLRAITL